MAELTAAQKIIEAARKESRLRDRRFSPAIKFLRDNRAELANDRPDWMVLARKLNEAGITAAGGKLVTSSGLARAWRDIKAEHRKPTAVREVPRTPPEPATFRPLGPRKEPT